MRGTRPWAHVGPLSRRHVFTGMQHAACERVYEGLAMLYVAARHVVTHHVHAPRCRMHGSWTHDTSEFAHTAASKTTVKGRQPPCRFCKGGTIGIASGSLVRDRAREPQHVDATCQTQHVRRTHQTQHVRRSTSDGARQTQHVRRSTSDAARQT